MLRVSIARGARKLARVRRGDGGFGIRSRGYAEAAATTRAADGSKVNFNFYLPHEAVRRSEPVDMVVIPAAGGVMGILPQHVPTVAQLRAGVVEVHNEDDVQRYFVSSGFCFVHKDRTDLCAVEAVKLEDVDAHAVNRGLADSEEKVGAAVDDVEKAEAQIGVDLYAALQSAISNK